MNVIRRDVFVFLFSLMKTGILLQFRFNCTYVPKYVKVYGTECIALAAIGTHRGIGLQSACRTFPCKCLKDADTTCIALPGKCSAIQLHSGTKLHAEAALDTG